MSHAPTNSYGSEAWAPVTWQSESSPDAKNRRLYSLPVCRINSCLPYDPSCDCPILLRQPKAQAFSLIFRGEFM